MAEFFQTHKRLCTIICIALAVVIIALVIILSSLKYRVVGTWVREPVYSRYYGGSIVNVLTLKKDGTYAELVFMAGGSTPVSSEFGTWKTSGKTIITTEYSDPDTTTEYTYESSSNRLKNGDLYYTKSK